MNLFPVYPLFDIELVRGKGSYVYDSAGKRYLDLYGGHAVISVGHAHPYYNSAIKKQLNELAYYSNSVKLPIQDRLCRRLGKLSYYQQYQLFLCNSGAEANENAMKVASFHTGRKNFIAFTGSFHGRTHGALSVTDDSKIKAPVNTSENVVMLPFNDADKLKEAFIKDGDSVAAVIIEPVQGVAGIEVADASFLQLIHRLCIQHGALFIADEIQSGCGRTGKFFAHQFSDVQPHLITMAKGIGNGFPVAGVLIHPDIQAWYGELGTTFGGNPLACAAAIAVLEIMKEEKLMKNAADQGKYLIKNLSKMQGVKQVRGGGLMIGIELDGPCREVREELLNKHRILTGNSKNPNVLRILPPLNIGRKELDKFLSALESCLNK